MVMSEPHEELPFLHCVFVLLPECCRYGSTKQQRRIWSDKLAQLGGQTSVIDQAKELDAILDKGKTAENSTRDRINASQLYQALLEQVEKDPKCRLYLITAKEPSSNSTRFKSILEDDISQRHSDVGGVFLATHEWIQVILVRKRLSIPDLDCQSATEAMKKSSSTLDSQIQTFCSNIKKQLQLIDPIVRKIVTGEKVNPISCLPYSVVYSGCPAKDGGINSKEASKSSGQQAKRQKTLNTFFATTEQKGGLQDEGSLGSWYGVYPGKPSKSDSSNSRNKLASHLPEHLSVHYGFLGECQYYVHADYDAHCSGKVAGFDLDGKLPCINVDGEGYYERMLRIILCADTLVRTKSGKRYPQNQFDWRWAHANVAEVLASLQDHYGYQIVIFTNQMGIGKNHVNEQDVRGRIEEVTKSLYSKGVLPVVFVSPIDDFYRKPRPGMWLLLEGACAGGKPINRSVSFFVGDAAGRTGDHSSSDVNFAKNLSLQFMTPERLFGEDATKKLPEVVTEKITKGRYSLREYSPVKSMLDVSEELANELSVFAKTWKDEAVQRAVLLSASPASGKTTFCKKVLEEHFQVVRVCQDDLKTKQKCFKAAEEALDKGKDIVIDATNRDAKTRSEWLSLFNKRDGLRKIAITLSANKEQSMRLNTLRKLRIHHLSLFYTGQEPSGVEQPVDIDDGRSVPAVVTHSFFKNFEMPTREEGFDEVYSFPVGLRIWDETLVEDSSSPETVHKDKNLVEFFLSLLYL